MLVIGLTGPSGAGKSTVSERLAAYGLPIIDADKVYHQLLIPPSPCLDELVRCFGDTILTTAGTLNRRVLGELVFSTPASLEKLNQITHRYVMEEIRKQLDNLRRKNIRAAVLDAPQLFEAGANRDCSVIISVLAAIFGWLEGFSQFFVLLYWLLGVGGVVALILTGLPKRSRFSIEQYRSERSAAKETK